MDQNSDSLCHTYWRDNMFQTALFSQALESAINQQGTLDLILEVGPHPTLQGPTLQVIHDACGQPVPYSGVLHRGGNDIESFADTLGFAWKNSSKPTVDFAFMIASLPITQKICF